MHHLRCYRRDTYVERGKNCQDDPTSEGSLTCEPRNRACNGHKHQNQLRMQSRKWPRNRRKSLGINDTSSVVDELGLSCCTSLVSVRTVWHTTIWQTLDD